jgi:hypothetical protein
MTNHLAEWAPSLTNGQAMKLPKRVVADGIRDQHLGPRWERAGVRIALAPAPEFAVQVSSMVSPEAIRERFTDAAILGVLDVLLVSRAHPIRDVVITLESVEVDPINSSWQAFRMAGRDAATKALALAFG